MCYCVDSIHDMTVCSRCRGNALSQCHCSVRWCFILQVEKKKKDRKETCSLHRLCLSLSCDCGLSRQEFSVDDSTGSVSQLVSGGPHATTPITTLLSAVPLSSDIHVKLQQPSRTYFHNSGDGWPHENPRVAKFIRGRFSWNCFIDSIDTMRV